jgi:hypothetical protein
MQEEEEGRMEDNYGKDVDDEQTDTLEIDP